MSYEPTDADVDADLATLDESDLSDATQARPEDVGRFCGCTADGPSLACQADGLWHGHGRTEEGSYDGPGWDKATRSIVSLAGLNWAGGVLREIRAAMAQNEEMAKAEIEALEHKLAVARLRLDRAQKPLKADAEFFERSIATYAQTHKAEILKGHGKRKSRVFPSGLTVAYRAVGGEYRWRQDMTPKEREEALLEWVRAEEDVTGEILTRNEPRPDLGAIKEHLSALGADDRAASLGNNAAPPGLEWVPESETITIKTGEEK